MTEWTGSSALFSTWLQGVAVLALTGTSLFTVLVVAAVVAVIGTIALRSQVRGPKVVRWLVHGVMIGVCQLTAICVVAT